MKLQQSSKLSEDNLDSDLQAKIGMKISAGLCSHICGFSVPVCVIVWNVTKWGSRTLKTT